MSQPDAEKFRDRVSQPEAYNAILNYSICTMGRHGGQYANQAYEDALVE